MQLTDLFIKRPVLATVVSLTILVLTAPMLSLPIMQYPFTQNAVVTVANRLHRRKPGSRGRLSPPRLKIDSLVVLIT